MSSSSVYISILKPYASCFTIETIILFRISYWDFDVQEYKGWKPFWTPESYVQQIILFGWFIGLYTKRSNREPIENLINTTNFATKFQHGCPNKPSPSLCIATHGICGQRKVYKLYIKYHKYKVWYIYFIKWLKPTTSILYIEYLTFKLNPIILFYVTRGRHHA